jgi:hypothetical protein
MEYNDIRKSCFELATHLMWEKGAWTINKIESNLSELNSIAEKLYKIAEDQFESRKNLEINSEIVSRAIYYINRVHTIPPLRGNYVWFENTLDVLLEIVCPNTLLKEESEHILFLNDIEKGLEISRNDAIDE